MQPDNTTALKNRATSYSGLSKYNLAFQDIERAMEIDPDNWEYPYLASAIYLGLDKPEKAIAYLSRAILLNFESPSLYNAVRLSC
jgi:tetratricopeptide (TPR) repeat protein